MDGFMMEHPIKNGRSGGYPNLGTPNMDVHSHQRWYFKMFYIYFLSGCDHV